MLTKDDVADIYPLAPMQEGMLVEFARDPAATTYVEQFDFHLDGEVNADALQRAVDALVRKYAVLRTLFSFRKTDQPRQVVLKSRAVPVARRDFGTLDTAEAQAAVAAYKREDRERGFDLSADVLVRLGLLALSPRAHRLVITYHHIILDGWCFGPLFADLFTYYERCCVDAALVIDEREAHPYAEYVHWIGAQDHAAASAYWAENLAGYEAVAGPPYHNRRHDGAVEHAEHTFALGRELTARLDAVARAQRVTVNSLFQAAWGVLLQKYHRCDDVAFGAVVAGRPPALAGVESMVGLFLNTQPLRVTCTADEPFNAVAARVHERFFLSAAYDYYPLAAVQSATALKNRLVNHTVTFENLPLADQMRALSAQGSLRVTDVEVFQAAKFDFHVLVFPGDDLRVTFAYNARRYDAATMATFGRSLARLLADVADDPSRRIAALRICADEDAARVLGPFNDTARAYPDDRSAVALLQEVIAERPDAVALRYAGRDWTYREMHERTLARAGRLRALGVAPGDRVALHAPRGTDMVITSLAILYCGAVYIPVEPGTTAERIAFVLDDAGARVLCSVPAYSGRAPAHIAELVVDAHAEEPGTPLDAPVPVGPTDPAYVIYTSGSTGQPKGCAVMHKSITRLVRNADYVDLGPHQRILKTTSPAFDVSIFEIWGALLNGGELCMVDEAQLVDARLLRAALRDYRITVLWLTTGLFNHLCDADPAMFADLAFLVVGGDVLSPRHMERVRLACPGVRLVNGYGPTENAVFSATFEIDRHHPDGVPIGRPIANSTAYILDADDNLLPPGAYGELVVGGDGVSLGYVNRPELNAAKFRDDPFTTRQGGRLYRTGDVARWLPDGTIDLLGRTDYQVKIRGFRVELGEIERALGDLDGVDDAVVIAPEGPAGRQLLAFYVGAQAFETHDLRARLARRLPAYMVPAFFLRLDAMPITPNGKLDRRALPVERCRAQRVATIAAEPRSATERRVAQICRDVLGVDDVGLYDNFFDAGGNSLSLMTIGNRLRGEFARDVPLAVLFEYTSIARLAEYLDGENDDAKRASEAQALDEARSVLLKTRHLMKNMEEA